MSRQTAHLPRLLVMGAVGRSGMAVWRELLGAGTAHAVTVLCTRALRHQPRGLQHAVVAGGAWPACLPHIQASDQVLMVFDQRRHAREAVFWQPPREALLPLAQALHAHGVRRLEVLCAPALAPDAAELGALQRLGYGVRVPQPRTLTASAAAGEHRSAPARLAAWLLHTLIDTLNALGAVHVKPAAKRARPRRRRQES